MGKGVHLIFKGFEKILESKEIFLRIIEWIKEEFM
jgi:hypothetical protein